SEDDMLTEIVIPFINDGVIRVKWGKKDQTYQVNELRVFQTAEPWYKKSGVSLDDFLKGKRNVYQKFEKKALKVLKPPAHRVFIIMPIQGEKFGSQDEQRIYREFDERFERLESILSDYDSVAIRIDKEVPLDDLVKRIKEEIQKSRFVIADLTDERPSCYFEAGYAEALGRHLIYIASRESVISPKKDTKIHFDIHRNVQLFVNLDDMETKIRAAIDKNKEKLLKPVPDRDMWQSIIMGNFMKQLR
ncbi:MAG TPA: hypothetical protein VJ987_00005, partial [Anaerolineales bacterium]|nr:hypothetical protein [Anaerolineales bacterium]